jgi:hypothetical protein
LAARNMAALLSNPSGPVQANPSSGWGLTNCTPDDVAALAVSLTDALIARLRPATVAPVADAAPRPEEPVKGDSPRSEWVRITSLPLGDDGRYPFAVGQVFKVAEWEDSAPRVIGPRREGITLSASGASIDPSRPGFATWEPCAAPAPLPVAGDVGPLGAGASNIAPPPPAASPAAYVPKCGDVVALTVCDVTGDALPHRDSLGAHLYRVESDKPDHSEYFKCVRVDGRDTTSPCFISARGMRPATAAERVAAGLDAPAVDREGLAKALRDGKRAWLNNAADQRDGYDAGWDAAIAFLKANGGVA